MAFDLFQHITDRMIQELEQGTAPWRKPWATVNSCVSHVTGKPYSLLNAMMLGKPGEYITFNQAKAEGGRIVKGAKSRMVVFWKPLKVAKKDDRGNVILKPDGSLEEEVRFVLRYYSVFLVGEDTEGISRKYNRKLPCTAKPDERAEKIMNAYISGSGVKLVYEKGDRAFYTPSLDTITLPLMDQFSETAEFYSTAFHEMGHSTGHTSRLARLDSTAHFGTEVYSKEELVAEMCAAVLVNHARLETPGSFSNSVSYCRSWLTVLKNDKRFIVSAATKAQKAVELVLSYSGETIIADEPDED